MQGSNEESDKNDDRGHHDVMVPRSEENRCPFTLICAVNDGENGWRMVGGEFLQ